MRIGIAWSTYFKRPWHKQVYYRRLRFAYRAPTFFAAGMLRQQAQIQFMKFDDAFKVADLVAKPNAPGMPVDVLYLAAHGWSRNGQYCACLHTEDWIPSSSGLADSAPAVVVFDTCDLVDLRFPTWSAEWSRPSVGRHLRLVLGFASQATVAADTTRRGEMFANLLATDVPIAQAWLKAVKETGYPGLDVGIAIALGDDLPDAQQTLENSRISAIPGPRNGQTATIAYQVSP